MKIKNIINEKNNYAKRIEDKIFDIRLNYKKETNIKKLKEWIGFLLGELGKAKDDADYHRDME